MTGTSTLTHESVSNFHTFLVKEGVNNITNTAAISYDQTIKKVNDIFDASKQMVPVYEADGKTIAKNADGTDKMQAKGLSQEELMQVQLMLLDAQQMLQMAKTIMGYEKSALNQATQAIQAA
ncbi:MAG: hypothetical protein ACRCWJ_17390 [Casimicrobium sp.]